MNAVKNSVSAVIEIACLGRKGAGITALKEPVTARVNMRARGGGSQIELSVECEHNTGSHGHRCKAASGTLSPEAKVNCPYAIDIPYYYDGMPIQSRTL